MQTWRENFLRVLLRGTIIFSLVALIAVFFTYKEAAFLIGFSTAYVILVVATIAPLPYWLRAGIFVSIFYLLGVSGLLETGISGSARVFFVSFVVLVGMLLSPRTATWAAVLSVGTALVAAWLILTEQYAAIRQPLLSDNTMTWVIGIASLIMLDAIMILGLSFFQSEFTNSHNRAVKALQAVEQERNLLERRVEERTEEIVKKTRQLEAASTVARKIAEIRDLQVLLSDVVHSIAEQFDFYHAGIFLLDDNRQSAVLQAASSEGGKKMLEIGHRLGVGQTGIVGYVTGRGRPRVALDTGTDAVFFNNPHLPLTHSEMALPLVVRGRVIGAIDIQSEKVNAFGEGDIEIMQTVADQLAIAIENTRLFTETEAIIGQLETLTALQTRDAWADYLKRRAPAYQYTTLGVRPLTESRSEESARSLRVPIELRGQEIGVINLRRKETSPAWSNREHELAKEIAAQVALALDTSRLLEETQKSAARDQMIANVSSNIRETLDMDSILKTAAVELRKAFGLLEAEVRLDPPSTTQESTPATSAEKTTQKSAGSNGQGESK